MSSKKAKRASAAGSSSGSFPTRKVLFARDPDGPRRLAEYFASLVAEHMRSGADREQLSIGVEQFSLDSTHLEALENAGAIERDDNTFLAERGEVFRVPQAERDRCARMDEAVRSLEERLEAVWPTSADAEGAQSARRTSLRLRVSKAHSLAAALARSPERTLGPAHHRLVPTARRRCHTRAHRVWGAASLRQIRPARRLTRTRPRLPPMRQRCPSSCMTCPRGPRA